MMPHGAGPTRDSLTAAERRVLAAVQDGLPPSLRPFDDVAARAAMPVDAVLAHLRNLLACGVIRRLGLVVRHHEMGYRHNAMVVFDVPDDQVAESGRLVAASGLATLCYRRTRRQPAWPYNLYMMVHAKSRPEALAAVGELRSRCGLEEYPYQILFCVRRFKQQGARYFDARP